MSHSKSSGTDSDNSNTIGIDDIELNVENTLLQACEANVCENNARCFMFEGTPRCCCSPGFEVRNLALKFVCFLTEICMIHKLTLSLWLDCHSKFLD